MPEVKATAVMESKNTAKDEGGETQVTEVKDFVPFGHVNIDAISM